MSITGSTAANLAGSLVPAVVSLVTVPLYIELVGHERYGILLLIWLLLGYFGLFDLGLGRATAQRIAAFATASDEARGRVFWTAFLLNAALGLLSGVVLWPLAELAFGGWVELRADLRLEGLGVVPWLAAAVPLVTVSGVLTGALQGREQFLVLNAVHVLGAVVSQVAPLAVATAWGPDIRLLVPTVLLTRAVTCLVQLALCRHYVPLRGAPAVDRTLLRPLLGYGSWITVTNLVGPLLTSLDRFVIGVLAGAKAVTQYTVPFTLVSRVMILPGSLSSALFSRFAAETSEGRGALLERAVRGLGAALTPLILAAMLGMRPFLTWWVGDEFSGDAATVGQIIALGLWVNGLAFIPHTLLEARARPDLVAKCHLVELPLYLGLLWAGLHFWGVVGAAVAWSLRAGLDAGLLFWLSRVEPRHLRTLAPSGALVAAMATLVLVPASTGHWQWILAAAVLLGSAAWSWRSGQFLVASFPRIRYLDRIDGGQRQPSGATRSLNGRGLLVESVSVHAVSGEERHVFEMNETLEIRFHVVAEHWIDRPWFSVGISDRRPGALVLCSMLERHTDFDLSPGRHVIRCRVGPLPSGPHTYELWMSVRKGVGAADLVEWAQVGAIRVTLPQSFPGPTALTAPWLSGSVRVLHAWSLADE